MENGNEGKQVGTDGNYIISHGVEREKNVSVAAMISPTSTSKPVRNKSVFNPYAAAANKRKAAKKKEAVAAGTQTIATTQPKTVSTTQSTKNGKQLPEASNSTIATTITSKESTSASCQETTSTYKTTVDITSKGDQDDIDNTCTVVCQQQTPIQSFGSNTGPFSSHAAETPPKSEELFKSTVVAADEVIPSNSQHMNSQRGQHRQQQKRKQRNHGWGNVPPWERLPSKNVTFGPAEILSVLELRENYSLYSDRSVRITGVLLHRYVTQGSDNDTNMDKHDSGGGHNSDADSTRIAFILGDPLELSRIPKIKKYPYTSTTTSTNTSKSLNLMRPLQSASSATSSKSGLGSNVKTPLIGKRKPILGGGGRPSSILISKTNDNRGVRGGGLLKSRSATTTIANDNNKNNNNHHQQPRVVLKKKTTASTISSNSTKKLLLGRKRPLSSITSTSSSSSATTSLNKPSAPTTKSTVSPLDTIVSTLLNKPSILILIHPSHVHTMDCNVGDLVMVMGEVAAWSTTTAASLADIPSCLNPLFQKWSSVSLEHELEKKRKVVRKQSTTITTTNVDEQSRVTIPSSPSVLESSKTNIKDAPASASLSEKVKEKDCDSNTKSKELSTNLDCYSYVKARITKNVNGTDMNLYQQALKLRRLQLLQLHHNSNSNNNNEKNNDNNEANVGGDMDVRGTLPPPKQVVEVLQGCGPPPYTSYNT